MPKVEMTINVDQIWDRYHDGKTTPDDVQRLLLAYDGAKTERDQLQRDEADIRADLAQARAALESTEFARKRAETALRQIKDVTEDALVLAYCNEGLGGVNG